MAKITKNLEHEWTKWLETAAQLRLALHEQTGALTLRRPERLQELQPTIDRLMVELKAIDERAAAAAEGLAEELGCEPHLRSLVAALEKPEAQRVHAIANKVIVDGRNLHRLVDKNRELIEGEMDYVNGTLALIARVAGEKPESYAPRNAKAAPVGSHLVNDVA